MIATGLALRASTDGTHQSIALARRARKQRQREFYAMLGMAAIGGLLLSLVIWFYYDRQVSGQMDRNAYLEAEIEKVKEQNKEIDRLDAQKERLLARKKVIEELQAKRSQMVHLFDALVRTIPDGLVLTALKQEGDVLTGRRTQSNARVSAYMRNLETSGWMTNPELSIIEARDPEKDKDGKTGPVAHQGAPSCSWSVKLPAQSEAAGTPGLNADGSVATPAPPAWPRLPPVAAAPLHRPQASPLLSGAPAAAAPVNAPAATPAAPNQPAAPAVRPAPKPEAAAAAAGLQRPAAGDRA